MGLACALNMLPSVRPFFRFNIGRLSFVSFTEELFSGENKELIFPSLL
jgi:hypothetical protein